MLGKSFWLLCSVTVYFPEEPSQQQSTQMPSPIMKIQKARAIGLSHKRLYSRNKYKQDVHEKPVLRMSSHEVKLYWHCLLPRSGAFAPSNTQGNYKNLRFENSKRWYLIIFWIGYHVYCLFFLNPCPLHTHCKTLPQLFAQIHIRQLLNKEKDKWASFPILESY